jgi:hypothetical protein
MTGTNIKNLPEGRTYFTECGWTDRSPWVQVRRTAKTATLARVNVTPDPDWKPNFHAGGFSAHCSNQGDQTWLFDDIDEGSTVTIRLTNRGWKRHNVSFSEGNARRYYDYNF